jgi:hypothetical protein
MKEYEQHEIGKCYPPLTDTERGLLRQQMLGPGSKSKVILFEDKILDGWHQYLICKELGIECEFEEVNPTDPIAFVIQRNEGRRQLSTTARAKIVDKLATLYRGGDGSNQYQRANLPTGRLARTTEQLAEEVKVGATTVGKLRIVNRNKDADPAIAEAVDKEEISIDAGYEAQRLPREKQGEALGTIKKKAGFYRGKRAGTSQKRSAPKRPEPVRPKGTPWNLSYEETGFPVNGTWAEQNAHQNKYGRTPVYPKAIADMMKHSQIVAPYVAAITMVSSDSHPSLEQFFASVDAMLAWVPDREKGKDWAENYAGKATKQLTLLEQRLPILLERLSRLQDILAQRKNLSCIAHRTKLDTLSNLVSK